MSKRLNRFANRVQKRNRKYKRFSDILGCAPIKHSILFITFRHKRNPSVKDFLSNIEVLLGKKFMREIAAEIGGPNE